MKLIIAIALFSVLLIYTQAEEKSKCNIDGVTDERWPVFSYKIDTPINDTHEGVTARFKTQNIKAVIVEPVRENVYLNAKFENDVLEIFTTEEFKNFEKNRKGSYNKIISIKFDFHCEDGNKKYLDMNQEVIDINNHDPTFNKEFYEYNFAMTIPEDFDLTQFQHISVSDDDYTNNKIYYTIESNQLDEILKLGYEGSTRYPDTKHYFATLKALKNITAPFKQEFTMVATDVGTPPKSTKVTVILNVISPANNDPNSENDDFVHPPVFSKHFYLANYTSDNDLKMEEKLTIKYGATRNMIVRQSDYAEYIKIVQSASTKEELEVKIMKPLSNEVLDKDFIIIEIEAENQGQATLGRTSLIVHLAKDKNNVHPPVFSEHLYFANYSNNELKMEEKIIIKYGTTKNTVVRQFGYEEYIKIGLNMSNNTELQVEMIKGFNNTILQNDMVVIEIEAENEGLSIPGRTALLIHISGYSGNNSQDCDVIHIWGFSFGDTVFSLILFLSAITIIVLLNVIVLALYFRKRVVNSSPVNNPRIINHTF